MVPSQDLKTAVLTGPTASGKSALALSWAERRGDIELISADSMTVYRGADVGTAKPSADELSRVRHHLIDIRDLSEQYTAGDFVAETRAAIRDIHSRGKRALIVGGTGFYLKALFFGIWDAGPADAEFRASLDGIADVELWRKLLVADARAAERISPTDHYRLVRALEILHQTGGVKPSELDEKSASAEPASDLLLRVIDRDKDDIEERIEARTRAMVSGGIIEEYRGLSERSPESRAIEAVGYAQVGAFLRGESPEGRKVAPGEQGLIEEIALATRQLVKRQRTWFKSLLTRMPEPAGKLWILDEQQEDLLLDLEEIYGS